MNNATSSNRIGVIVSEDAPALEQFAAQELCGYLDKLFGIQAEPSLSTPDDAEALFLIGSPQTNNAVRTALDEDQLSRFNELTDQGLILCNGEFQDTPCLVAGGGSPRATLWAVYELVERWGVRYLSDRDVLPEKTEFNLPALDVSMEPNLRVRAHPTIQDFACSGEAWGLADFQVLLNQLAKMKFSRITAHAFAWQPYLHWECQGVARQTSWLWYDDHYPITDDMPGRELFGDATEFWNPDLPLGGTYEETAAAGERLLKGIHEHAHQRGLECGIYADLTQFTPEFGPLLKNAQIVHQVGRLTVVPGPETEIDDPQYFALASSVLQATLNTYPDADLVMVSMPEWRQWVGVYEEAWRELDAKYGISEVCSLEQVIHDAENRKWGRGEGDYGVNKARDEVKGDLALLYFYDRLLHNPEIVGKTKRPDVKFMYHGIAEELFPILDRLLPPGSELGTIVDNFPTKILARREVLEKIPAQGIKSVIDLTIDDDNVGIVPQLSTSILHELLDDLRRNGWAGFVARERFPADHDSALAYLAKAAWDTAATPAGVIHDQVATICGEDCVEDMQSVLHTVEAVTAHLETHDNDFAFPLPGMMMQYWDGRCFNGEVYDDGGPLLPYLDEVRRRYQLAIACAQRAHNKIKGHTSGNREAGLAYTGFWIGRLTFALNYVEAVQTLRHGGRAEAQGNNEQAIEAMQKAIATMRWGLEAYARVARNPTDLGTIALVNEHCYRALQLKLEELQSGEPALQEPVTEPQMQPVSCV